MGGQSSPAFTRREVIQRAAGVAAAVGAGGYLLSPNPRARAYPSRKRVRFWHLLNAEWQEPTERIVARFNESQTKYEVVPLLIPDTSADSKFLLSVSGGDPPDVMLHWTQAISTWAEGGLLYPLDTLMTREEKQRFLNESYPVVSKSGWYKDHLYGLTEGFDLFVCYVRLDHFRQAGIDPDTFPTTLEGLVELGSRLHKFDAAGNLTRIGFLPQTFHQYVAAFGGGFYDWDRKQLTLNTPQNLRALTYLYEQRKKLGLDNVLRFISGLSSGSGLDWPFIAGAYSIALDGEWRVEQLRRFAPELEYRTIPLPPPAGGRLKASWGDTNFITIPSSAKEIEGAWEFIKFMTGLENPERAAEFYPWLGWMPMGPKSEQAPAYEDFLRRAPQYRTFLDVARSRNIEITPPVPYQLYLRDRITRADDLVMRGSRTPEAALIELEADIAKERAKRKGLGYAE